MSVADFVVEPERKVPVAGRFDVVVAGGGPAGYCAAVAAARRGARVLLVEREGLPGGSAVQSLVLPLMTFHAAPDLPVVAGIGQELVARVVAEGGSPGHIPDPLGCAATVTPVDPEAWKQAVVALVAGAGISLRLHASVSEAVVRDGRVEGVVVEGKSGRQAFLAPVVVDATGDGDVASRAGAETVTGRSRDGLAQPMTWMFRLGGVDREALIRAIRAEPEEFVLSEAARHDLEGLPCLGVAGFFARVRAAREAGELGGFRDRVLCFELPAACEPAARPQGPRQRRATPSLLPLAEPGALRLRPCEVMVNMTRSSGKSGADAAALTAGALEAYGQVAEVVRFLRRRIPGFEAARLIETAARVGVRETRHLVGVATLTEDDVVRGRSHPDGVARGAFPIDLHAPVGDGLEMIRMAPGAWYSIPYGCMVPRRIGGLLVTGRAISATHEASASARLSPTCMALGEAAGVAAALAVRAGREPRDLDPGELRAELEAGGAIV